MVTGRDRSLVLHFLAVAGIDSLGAGIGAAAVILYFVTMRGLSAEAVTLAVSIGGRSRGR